MEQHSLFADEPKPHERSVEDVASHIAEHAQPVEYEDRTSVAAREDQGWGPVDLPPNPKASPPRARRRPAPIPGRVRGDTEFDTGRPHYHEPFVSSDRSETESAQTRLGIAASRAMLNRDKNP